MKQRLRIGVIGAGVMGEHHINLLQKMDTVDFIGCVEKDVSKKTKLEKEKKCPIFSLEEFYHSVDAVVIATPSSSHFEISQYFLNHGIHCLVEKPLALTAAECLDLTKLAQQKKCQLMVGHIEEFNPGFIFLKEWLEKDKDSIISMDFSRINYGSQRISDTDVVLDLMTHDIGCALHLLNAKEADYQLMHAVHVKNNNFSDISKACTFIKNIMVSFTANRVGHKKERLLTVHTKNYCYELDFVSQKTAKYQKGSLIEEHKKVWHPPLENEINHFIDCINRDIKPITSGKHGYNIINLANAISSMD